MATGWETDYSFLLQLLLANLALHHFEELFMGYLSFSSFDALTYKIVIFPFEGIFGKGWKSLHAGHNVGWCICICFSPVSSAVAHHQFWYDFRWLNLSIK